VDNKGSLFGVGEVDEKVKILWRRRRMKRGVFLGWGRRIKQWMFCGVGEVDKKESILGCGRWMRRGVLRRWEG
jgi:hypothetical protein